jgi:hypothetical protein
MGRKVSAAAMLVSNVAAASSCRVDRHPVVAISAPLTLERTSVPTPLPDTEMPTASERWLVK